MSKHPLDDLLADGTIDKALAECRTDREMSARLGVTVDALQKWRRRRGLDTGYRKNVRYIETAERRRCRGCSDCAMGGSSSHCAPGNYEIAPDRGADGLIAPDDFADEAPTMPGVNAFDAAPDGFHVRGVSTLYDRDGGIAAQWVKTGRSPDDPIKAITDAFADVRDELPRATVFPPMPQHTRDDLLSVHLIGDGHLGMHAWHEDAGENYDLEIAERNLMAAFDRLVDLSPPSSKALLINIGDYTHSDNRQNSTTKGTPVDVDGRWIKVVKASVRTRIHHIKRALEKHDEVHDIEEIGNHDTHVSLFLSLALALYFENEPRVHIDVSPQMFHWFRFGRNLIGTHHGHMVKPNDLLGVMVSDRAQDWGETIYRYFYTGHIHHERVREYPGMLWESLRSPAPSDAWHHASGYRSGHDVKLDVLHRDRGRVQRHTVGVSQLLEGVA